MIVASAARRREWRGGALVLLVACLLLAACRNSSAIATLDSFTGKVDRDRAKSVGRWETAARQASFDVGDAVRTAERSKATMRLFDQSTLGLEQRTIVRFLDRPSGSKKAKVELEMGEATLEVGNAELDLDLGLGSAVIEPRGKIRLVRSGDAVRFEVVIGAARLLTDRERIELEVGEAVDILPDRSLRRAGSAAASASAVASLAPSAAPEPADSVSPLEITPGASSAAVPGARSSGPAVVDFGAAPGDSFVIHDPRPPTAVAFAVAGRCPGTAVLTVDPGRAKAQETAGEGRVAAMFSAGTHRYALSCQNPNGSLGPRVAEGTISVVADAGSRQLAKSAPASSVDTDGRRYTVLYQTLLPKISVRWPNAPTAASYALAIRSPSGSRSYTSKTPSYSLGAGTLGEGEHTLVFEANGMRSKATSVLIRFDNAAPTASIASPPDGGFSAGSSVLVSGAALPGFTVTVGGKELAQDSQSRFSEEVTAPAGERALVIRFSQPGRGVHYYLRRSAQ
jgi:hypothetical protein